MTQAYSFPILNDQELLACMREMGLPLSAAQLAKPSQEVVKPVYEAIVADLMGITREELQQPVFAAIDIFEFPELHDESIPFMAFNKSLAKLMQVTGVKDFSLQDLCSPEASRLRRNLSAIINFAKFREEKLQPYIEMQEETNELLEETERLKDHHANLTDEVRRLEELRAAEQPEVEALKASAQSICHENQQLNRQQITLNTEARALKNQANQLTSEAADLKFKLQNTRQKATDLRSQVVEAPEKLEERLQELQQLIDKERSNLNAAERKSRDLQIKLDSISKVEKDVQKAMAMMDEVGLEIERKKETSKKVKAVKAEIQANEAEASQLMAHKQHLQRCIQMAVERHERLEKQTALRKDAAMSAVDEQRHIKEAVEAENAANIAKMAEHEAAMRGLREKIREMQLTHDNAINSVLERYKLLKKQMQMYHDNLEQAMRLPPKALR